MFSQFFIHRPRFAIVISIVIVIAGLLALNRLPIAEYPAITPPQIVVSTNYTGADAQTVQQTVAVPIETVINGVENMLYMSSTSSNDGSYALNLVFEVGTDPEQAAINVQNRVARAQPLLPQEVVRNGISTITQTNDMLMVIALTSPNGSYDELFLSNYSSIYVESVISRIHGVGKATQFGDMNYSMRVWLNPERMSALNLTANDINRAIQQQNVQAALGKIGAPPLTRDQQLQYSITASGKLKTVAEFENIVILTGSEGQLIRLKDVARVELGSQDYTVTSQIDGSPGVVFAIYLTPGANALQVADNVYEAIKSLSQNFPDDVAYQIFYDSTESVNASIKEVIQTLSITFMLVVAVTFLFLGDWRATLVPATAIPISLIGTFAVLWTFDFTINTVSLFALILAIGIVVDDAIVVVENVKRHMQNGLNAVQASQRSMSEVVGPVIATTLVLLAVFVPVAFMPGLTGKLYTQFAITISSAVILSSIVALTLSPALCALLLKPTQSDHGFFARFSAYLDTVKAAYLRGVIYLNKRLFLAFILLLIISLAIVVLLNRIPTGFIPTEDKSVLFVDMNLPEGASLNRTKDIANAIEHKIRNLDGVERTMLINGFGLLAGGVSSNSAFIMPILENWNKRPDLPWQKILNDINAILLTEPGADAFVFPPAPIPGVGNIGGLEANLIADGDTSPQQLAEVSNGLILALNSDSLIERAFTGFNANTPQLELIVDRDKAESLNVPVSTLFESLQSQLGSNYVNDFNLYGRNFRVLLQADSTYRDSIADIGAIHVRSTTGDFIPVSSLLTVRQILGPKNLTRYNMSLNTGLAITPIQDASNSDVMRAAERIAKETLPESYHLEWTGSALQEEKAGDLILAIFTFSLLFAYLFLVAQYESWSLPVSVILSVTIAILGALLPMYLLPNLNNNLYAQIGMVTLIGLASKSAILIVEFAKQAQDKGLTVYQAVEEAVNLRFRAVMMTSFSFILGVAPLIFASGAGAMSRLSIGYVVLFGMLASAAFSVLLLPSLYVMTQKLIARNKI